MRILSVHNFYQQPGGEDAVFAAEAQLLEAHGHQVHRYTEENASISAMGRVRLAASTLWNQRSYEEIHSLTKRFEIELVHFHNTFPLISPSGYHAASRAGAAVVQTLHNYRLVCLNGLLLREGAPCELCIGRRVPWAGVVHACYRGDRLASAATATMLSGHRALGSYDHPIDLFLAPTQFVADKHQQGGLPGDRITIKPHFVPSAPEAGTGEGDYALFAGRLSVEKGIDVLLAAWSQIGTRLGLKIVGEGPLGREVERAAAKNPRIEYLGQRPRGEVLSLMKAAKLIVVPSNCYETFSLVIAEAFACGTPPVVAGPGAAADLIEHARTGLLFARGDASDLATQVGRAIEAPSTLNAMRRAVRAEYEQKYTAEANCVSLLSAYQRAIERRLGRAR
jgi:glycosyltransferase involved in cell wall biosynthesis